MSSWSNNLKDAVLDNSALRDGLTDEEAQPLVDWGIALAERSGETIVPLCPDEAEILFEEKRGVLLKLLTRITWVTLHRENKGAEWATRTLEQLNDLNKRLQGDAAPQLSASLIDTYARQLDGLGRGALVLDLITRLSPVQPENSENDSEPPGTPRGF